MAAYRPEIEQMQDADMVPLIGHQLMSFMIQLDTSPFVMNFTESLVDQVI
ncbi:MAG: hypothetical protein WD535_01555 [Thermaerobacterales bacterium]